ncbi:unnamed protein product [Caenorhabditis bovis]|uniref:Alpha-1,3/1,6-mannosyltransferase ALG2 n=1 Tax=Caenorhabditis bovis TaxID=2654633 RepID=A0A8S1ENH7_9PELO|nr:unnamed protein product [Caenorhabditis bovis]
MRVTILHPDLGIGGAERLIVDAAVALQNKGHQVRVVTNQFDRSHAFKETEQLEISSVLQWFPRSLFGKMHALFAYFKMIVAAFYIAFFYSSDVILSDQVSASLIVLKYLTSARLIFYCHFPDMLLTKRETAAKSIYRYVLDKFEEYTTSLADVICVNSKFTASIVRNTFKSLKNRELTVIYPSLNTEFFDSIESCDLSSIIPPGIQYVFTSLNRFERKKNIILAIEAFAKLREDLSQEEFSRCHLVIAGGYDKNNAENLEYFDECVQSSNELKIPIDQIRFITSPSDEKKISLIRRSRAVLYTPDREHFGIVPVEAMYLGAPVIAVNSGGPMESVENETTGFLVDQTPEEFALKMLELIKSEHKYNYMSKEGPKRVNRLFGFAAFTKKFDAIVRGENVDN